MEFVDNWLWLIFIGVGLILAMVELLIGVETGLDLVFIGSAFALGGLVTLGLHSWLWTVIATVIICLAYVAIGRRYVHRWTAVKKAKTNIDAIIGKRGIVTKGITRSNDGLVKIENERWRARAEVDISKGEEVVVKDVTGATLIVEKIKEGGK